ncbi:PAS domain S-box protein [Neobacillus jeddahensis]|uniref:PAS domain S-box protein n=1 Tax=Neobacillus jeddahensis TaxID=1461580 RepID=UPI000AFDB9B9|nr:PAS domain S-box protein [Neobacillus jeddahensis]
MNVPQSTVSNLPFDPIILKAKVEGFVNIYKLNQQLIQQAKSVTEKTSELENAYLELSKTTADLRVSEELANVISETSIDSMIVMDDKGFILKVNPAVEKMFDYDETSIIGKNITLLFSGEESHGYIRSILANIHNVNSVFGNENLKEVIYRRPIEKKH